MRYLNMFSVWSQSELNVLDKLIQVVPLEVGAELLEESFHIREV